MIIYRCWNQIMNYFVQFLEQSSSNILGNVDGHFSWKEFQTSEGALGNKPHGHGSASLLDETKEYFTKRICVKPEFSFTEKFNYSFKELLADGLVDDRDDYDNLVPFLQKLMTHVCSQSNGRCMKIVGDDNKNVCRFKEYPKCSENHYKERIDVYSDEVYEILNELGLADAAPLNWEERYYDLSNGKDFKWNLHKSL